MRATITCLALALLAAALPLHAQALFTKITTGDIVTDFGASQSCAWTDFNNDGHADLFVANYSASSNARNVLYQNNGDGTFTKLTDNGVVTTSGQYAGGVWADADNDGLTDLFVVEYRGKNQLYRNRGGGVFEAVPMEVQANLTPDHFIGGAAWGDLDNDGLVDLFVAMTAVPNLLYRNEGKGTLAQLTNSVVAAAGGNSSAGTWGDYDNDGWLDLFAPNVRFESDYLYHNEGNGNLSRVAAGAVVSEALNSWGGAWADYNNDGFLDLFVPVAGGGTIRGRSLLYQNTRHGSFQAVNGTFNATEAASVGAAWGDYDNDGFLDLFVANGLTGSARNALFHNNGDGTFTKITSGAPVTDSAESVGPAWADYDNDGFLDLFVANGNPTSQRNFLYRNNGNANHWLMVKLLGSASNRTAIGAKLRLQALIGGRTLWQMREISGGTSISCQNDPRAHFGLGDATAASLLRIEWPSGLVQELENVRANQILTIAEPPQGTAQSLRRGSILKFIGSPTDIAIARNYAFVSATLGNDPGGSAELNIVDISDPMAPRLVTYEQKVSGGSGPLKAHGKILLWSRAAVDDAGEPAPVLEAQDMTDPLRQPPPGRWRDLRAESLSRADFRGDVAHVAWTGHGSTNGGIVMVDFTDLASPREVGRYELQEEGRAIAIKGDLALLATFERASVSGGKKGRLRILNVADPLHIQSVGVHELGDLAVADLQVVGDHVYLVGLNGETPDQFVIVDAKNAANPKQVGTWTGQPDGIAIRSSAKLQVANNRAVIADLWGVNNRIGAAILVLDVTDPANVRMLDTAFGREWSLRGAAQIGSRIYGVGTPFGQSTGGLLSFDLKTGVWLDIFGGSAGNPVRVSWNHTTGYKLLKSTSLVNPVWQDVSLPGLHEGRVSIDIDASGPSGFFRLERP
jgi:hypothetical protein